MQSDPSEVPGIQGSGTYTGSNARSHAILVVMFLVYMSDYIDRYVVASMIEFIKKDWHITDAQAGSLMSVVLFFITVFTLPASILIDRWSRRKMVSLMVFLWSLATLACAFTRNYTQLFVARAFIGIGEAGYAPGGSAMLAAAYPEDKRAKVLGIWNASIPLGAGLGLLAGGLIARHWGWQHAFGLVSLPGILLALASWFLPDYKSVRPEASMRGFSGAAGFFRKALQLCRIPSLILTYLGFAMNVAVTTALMTWLPSYFERSGLAEAGKGGTYTMPIFALVLVGAPLGGFLSDAWRRTRSEARMIFPALTSLAAAAVLLVALLFPGKAIQLPIMIFYGILATCFVAPGASVTQDLVHPGLRAFSYALCVIVQHMCGDIWSPWLVGAVSDRIGLSKAMLVVPFFGVVAAVLFYVGSRFYNRDLARVERVELEAE
jgi:predicted MFS family arabinose efflux permease